jgi:hypothetical protein
MRLVSLTSDSTPSVAHDLADGSVVLTGIDSGQATKWHVALSKQQADEVAQALGRRSATPVSPLAGGNLHRSLHSGRSIPSI